MSGFDDKTGFSDKWYIREDILEFYEGRFREDSNSFHADTVVCDFVSNDSQDMSWVIAEMKIMEEEGLLKKIMATTSGGTFYTITAKGIQEYETTYNKEWIFEQYLEKQDSKENEYYERKNQEKLEDKRHKEMVQVAKDANYWNRIGIIAAGIMAFAALIVSIFKP